MNWSYFFDSLESFLFNLVSFLKNLSGKKILLAGLIVIALITFYLKITWPQLALIIFLLFVFLFRSDISKLLGRALKISKDGILFDTTQNAPPSTFTEETRRSKYLFENIVSLETITETEKSIRDNHLSNKTTNPNMAIDTLVHELASVIFILRCERVYKDIFGSQIELLKKLASNINFGLTENELEQHFQAVTKRYPEFIQNLNWTTQNYIFILIQSVLITFQTDNRYHITIFGMDFLTWLQRTGMPENKAY